MTCVFVFFYINRSIIKQLLDIRYKRKTTPKNMSCKLKIRVKETRLTLFLVSLTLILSLQDTFFGVVFLLYLIKLSAGKGILD